MGDPVDSSVIQLKNVSFTYDGPPVLQDVTLDVYERDFVCMIGPNGGGKTTLLNLMLGLLEPDAGTVQLLGDSPARSRMRVGYMPQRAKLDPEFPVSVMDVVLMGRLGQIRLIGGYSKYDKQVTLDSLNDVGLADVVNRPFSALSGGQRQRVLIARALACEPEVLLLDEPTANLDPAVQEDIYALMKKLNEKLTVLIVSHDVGFVSTWFQRVICVNRDVHVHATEDLTGERVANMYGRQVRLLHHPKGCCPDHD